MIAFLSCTLATPLSLLAANPVLDAQDLVAADELEREALSRPAQHGGFGAFAFHPNEKTLVGGIGVFEEVGGEILIWDVKSGKIKKELGKHTATPTWVAFTPDGKGVLSFSSDDALLNVWGTSGKKPKASLTLGGGMNPERPPQLASDGSFLVHAVQLPQTTRDPRSAVVGALEVWDLKRRVLRWKRDASYAQVFALSPDDARIAVWINEVHWSNVPGKRMRHVRSVLAMLDAQDGATLWEVPTEKLKLLHLCFAQGGAELAAVSFDTLFRFSSEDGVSLGAAASLDGTDSSSFPLRVALTPDGAGLIVERSMGESLDLYDLEQGLLVRRIDFSGLDDLTEVTIAPSRTRLVGKLGYYPEIIELGELLLR